MPIDLRLLNLFFLYCQNCTAIVLKTLKKSQSLNLYRYLNLIKIFVLCRLILRLFNALFILNCKFQNCTAIVQLKVTI